MKIHSIKHILLHIAAFIACISLIQCTKVIKKSISQPTTISPDGHNSANSLDWNGTYKGTMPCADCDGIETEITLTTDQDYILKTNHIGKTGTAKEAKGNFTWNSSGNTITLSGTMPHEHNQYFIGENRLLQLDNLGNKRAGTDADKYFLIKQTPDILPDSTKLAGNWQLNYIANSTIDFQDLYPNKKPTINFDTINNAISGNTSCNNFAGKMNVNGNKIDFTGPIAMTKMMCLDGKGNGENVFIETLKKVNTYSIGNDSTLNFIMGDMALMRFSKILPPQYKP
jgi:heat shock protein HslJ/uncharacterized lipoprotein NlpE involved in copper resistance